MVATFCHVLTDGGVPKEVDDKPLPLVHVGSVADLLLDQALAPTPGQLEVPGWPTMVSEVAEQLIIIAGDYRTGPLPDLSDAFTKNSSTPTARQPSRNTSRSIRHRPTIRVGNSWRQ